MSRIDHHRPHYPDLYGYFRRSYHLEMISDRARREPILRALRRSLDRETVFCELGCGTGIFSIYAAARSKTVYAIELDPLLARIARVNIARSRFADRIHLIEEDALKVQIPEKADVVFCEMMSIWTVEEPEIPVFNHARSEFLKEDGIFLPQRIINLVEIGWYDFCLDEVELKTPMPAFTGVTAPTILTERRVAKVLSFTEPLSTDLSCEVELEALAGGLVNCACLSSIVQVGPGVVFSGSDSLMPPTVVPLTKELTVKSGDQLRFLASAQARSDLGKGVFEVQVA